MKNGAGVRTRGGLRRGGGVLGGGGGPGRAKTPPPGGKTVPGGVGASAGAVGAAGVWKVTLLGTMGGRPRRRGSAAGVVSSGQGFNLLTETVSCRAPIWSVKWRAPRATTRYGPSYSGWSGGTWPSRRTQTRGERTSSSDRQPGRGGGFWTAGTPGRQPDLAKRI